MVYFIYTNLSKKIERQLSMNDNKLLELKMISNLIFKEDSLFILCLIQIEGEEVKLESL